MNKASPRESGPSAAWDAIVQALPDPAWLVALPSLSVVSANDNALDLLGVARAQLIGARADQLIATPEDLAYWQGAAAGDAGSLTSDTLLTGADGRTVFVRRNIRALVGPDRAAPGHCLVTLLDVTAEREALAQHEDTQAELRGTLEATADGILVTDLSGRIRAFNRRFAHIFGLPPELLDAQRDEAVHDWMRRSVQDPAGYQQCLDALNEAVLLSGTERIVLLSGQVLERVARPLWSRGRPLGRVFSFRDLSEGIQADERIETLARTDSLTGLPNRRFLAEQIEQLALSIRHDGDSFALLLVDMDRFRRVNDSLGHAIGDRVLRDVAERLRRCMRQGDEMARVSGDQFALLMRHADAAAAEAAALRVLDAIAEPWHSDGVAFTLTCSVGIALCPGHGRRADELMRRAEGAMRQAKQAGSNGLCFHQQRADVDLRQQMQLDHAMRQALASNRFRLHYQPQVEMATGRIVGAEALIRWRDPALGEVAPMRFIPVAEDTGFIIAIGDWVLSQAVRQAALWDRAGLPIPIAINVSALQFQQPQFVDRVAAVLREHGLPPERLELELTESVLMEDAERNLRQMHALRALGVRLSIDDFGTGYSSLAYLKRFPIDKVKIDRSFVKGLPDDESDAGIVRAIMQMAHALGMAVIAEGVETEPQRRFLLEAGCEHFQGFLFAPALDALTFAQRAGVPAAPRLPARSAVVHHLHAR